MKRSDKSRDSIRTFIAIEIPESIKDKIARLQRGLKKTEAQVSWTRPSNVHLTLKFLGAVPASRIKRVTKALERAAQGIASFETEIADAGCFPSVRSPRVLWVGFGAIPEELQKLYNNLEEQLDREGFPRETRKFSPHLTIGRVRTPGKATAVAEQLIATGFRPERFVVSQVIVMRSDLKPTGSIYTPQAVIKLG